MAPRPKIGAGRRVSRRGFIAAAAAASALCAAMLAPAQGAAAASPYVPISGAGSTWSYNAISNWITNIAQLGMVVNYSPVGSISGLQEFADGTADWGASEIPYGVKDGGTTIVPPARGYAYMPDTAGGVALMYNLQIGGQRVTNLRLPARPSPASLPVRSPTGTTRSSSRTTLA